MQKLKLAPLPIHKRQVPIEFYLKDDTLPQKNRELVKEGNMGTITYCDNELEFFHSLAWMSADYPFFCLH